ncbi:MAG: hypothetical protein DHS20C13_25800 [Thermodesulfobacteriota bacterium]|nr:MAG: hypothetical protein DHS20C13_25800 [Thermodesulfobacteriota bacterium]
MIRDSLIIILCILLGISSYIIYKDQYVVIKIETDSPDSNKTSVQDRETNSNKYNNDEELVAASPKVTLSPDIIDEVEELEEDSDIEVHLDPTVGVDINTDQQIASSYRVIGPRQFVLLTKKDEPMVEIDLDTGNVKINPEYELNEVSKEFWNSIGKKYPEVCFVETK